MYKIENIKVTTGKRGGEILLNQSVDEVIQDLEAHRRSLQGYYKKMFALHIKNGEGVQVAFKHTKMIKEEL